MKCRFYFFRCFCLRYFFIFFSLDGWSKWTAWHVRMHLLYVKHVTDEKSLLSKIKTMGFMVNNLVYFLFVYFASPRKRYVSKKTIPPFCWLYYSYRWWRKCNNHAKNIEKKIKKIWVKPFKLIRSLNPIWLILSVSHVFHFSSKCSRICVVNIYMQLINAYNSSDWMGFSLWNNFKSVNSSLNPWNLIKCNQTSYFLSTFTYYQKLNKWQIKPNNRVDYSSYF